MTSTALRATLASGRQPVTTWTDVAVEANGLSLRTAEDFTVQVLAEDADPDFGPFGRATPVPGAEGVVVAYEVLLYDVARDLYCSLPLTRPRSMTPGEKVTVRAGD